MLKISYAGCLDLSPAISSQFSVVLCVASKKMQKNCEKLTKILLRDSRSFKVIDVDKSKKPVTSACYGSSMSVPICNRFHTIRANNGKLTF